MYAPPKAVFDVPPGYFLYDPLLDSTDWSKQAVGSTRRISNHIICSDLALRTLGSDTEALVICRLTGSRYRGLIYANSGDCHLTSVDHEDVKFSTTTPQLLQNHWVLLKVRADDDNNDDEHDVKARVFVDTTHAADALVARSVCFNPVRRSFHTGPWVITGFPDTLNAISDKCACNTCISKLKGDVLFVTSHVQGCTAGCDAVLSQLLVNFNENALYVTKKPHNGKRTMVDKLPPDVSCTLAVAVYCTAQVSTAARHDDMAATAADSA